MRSYRYVAAILLMLGLGVASSSRAWADDDENTQPLTSETKQNAPTAAKIPLSLNEYKITASGSNTLVKGDTWVGFKMEFKDPNNNTPAPTLIDFTVPQPGETKTYKYEHVTKTTGKWVITATMDYKTGAVPGTSVDQKDVDVK